MLCVMAMVGRISIFATGLCAMVLLSPVAGKSKSAIKYSDQIGRICYFFAICAVCVVAVICALKCITNNCSYNVSFKFCVSVWHLQGCVCQFKRVCLLVAAVL